MNIVVDTHVHTISSGHAYSTVQEIAKAANKKGIEMLAITDHGPYMEGAASALHFANLRVLPEKIDNVIIMKGIEANIINYSGEIDLEEKYLKRLDFVIASFHDVCIEPLNCEQHTNALIKVLENPYVDAIGHPGNPVFQVDIERVVRAAKKNKKFIEINNNSYKVRKGSEGNCLNFLKACKEQEVKVVCGSDSHVSFDVGNFENVKRLLTEVDMPERLVMSSSVLNFKSYLEERKKRFKG